MARLCKEDNIAMTPYSALAGGRLSKHHGETSKRLQEDSYARLKYDTTAAQDSIIIDRVAEFSAVGSLEQPLNVEIANADTQRRAVKRLSFFRIISNHSSI